MKIRVNRNNFAAKVFIDQLISLGVTHACISPGSRSTPLTYALSENRRIKSFIHFDERSSAFFALGLAKATEEPVIVITTSGTAVAELYPAIIEAYMQRVPLIVCTADRPPELIGTGANQTINQRNIFKNHIRWFKDLGLPLLSKSGLQYFQKVAIKAFQKSLIDDKGPVHLNFPFRKPLEPSVFTDEVSKEIFSLKPQKVIQNKTNEVSVRSRAISKLVDELESQKRGLIIVGPMDYNQNSIVQIKKLSALLKYPILADGLSQLRFGVTEKDKNVLCNSNFFLQVKSFIDENDPEIILQFGRTPTSSALEKFLTETKANRYLINQYGDKFDPSRNAKKIFSIDPKVFCEGIVSRLKSKKFNRGKSAWQNKFVKAEGTCEKIKLKYLDKPALNEPSIILETINTIPSGSHIFIGNSLPVRDLDHFLSNTAKKLTIYFNRGASGIDGVTSSALGIAAGKKHTFLITGDLSFLHDLGALSLASKYSAPLTIVLINNNGGGIFESLPIAKSEKIIKEYFTTPHNLNLSEIVKSFGISYSLINNRAKLKNHILKSLTKKSTSVLEVKTDAGKSVEIRKNYLEEVQKKLNKELSK